MLFVRTPPTVVVEDPEAIRAAEERGRDNGFMLLLGALLVIAAVMAVGYFAWWAPFNSATATPTVIHDTHVIQQPASPTIVNPPPTIIQRDRIVPVPVPKSSTDSSSNAGSGDSDAKGSDSSAGSSNSSTTGQ